MTDSQALKDAIETLIDENRLSVVLDAIAEVCREKADHIRTNWQNVPTAREWDRTAKRIESLHNIGV